MPEPELFKLESNAGVPKYKQIINSFLLSVEEGRIDMGEQLPSINFICKTYGVSRDTVLIAFNELKAKGIISSTPGKGYFLNSKATQFKKNIFLLYDEFNVFKEILYNAFVEELGDKATVDIYFHHFNKTIFKSLVDNNIGKYNSYIVMPAKFHDAYDILKQLPQEKVFVLDQTNEILERYYPAIYQNFEKDMFTALESGVDLLEKYQKIFLVYPGGKEPEGQKRGFLKFAEKYANKWQFQVLNTLDGRTINKHEVYIVPNDIDLVTLVKSAKEKAFVLGDDLGIISYNDTPLKEIVADGITTISTDFRAMGERLAQMVLAGSKDQIENKSELIRRESL